jgi:hypothetical protein
MNQQETLERIAYEQMCGQFGLKPEWLGKTFFDKGTTYTIVGLNIRSKRFPVRTSYEISYTGDKTKSITTRCAWNATHVAGRMGDNLAKLLNDEQAQKRKQERADYQALASAYGLKPEWLDKQFAYKGRKVTVVGLAPNRRRYPVVGRDERGTIRLYPIETVTKALSAAAAQKDGKQSDISRESREYGDVLAGT